MLRTLWTVCLLLTFCTRDARVIKKDGLDSTEDNKYTFERDINTLNGYDDGEPNGPDTSMCKYYCGNRTKKLMKESRQCTMRCARHSGAFTDMTDEDFNKALSEVTDMCRIDDWCVTEPQAQNILYNCMQQEADITGQSIHHSHRTKRAFRVLATRWPTDIPIEYNFDATYSTDEMALIENAIDVYRAYTCISFMKTTATTGYDGLFFRKGSGCSSFVGMILSEDPQDVMLAASCLSATSYPGTVLHEILHALGVLHEQVRSDRDEHVTYYQANVRDSQFLVNFNKEADSEMNTPYDVTSVMHYSKGLFGRNGSYTTVPNDPALVSAPGQRVGLSFYDLQELNSFYCNDSCVEPPEITCLNGGYQNPANCSKCICTEAYNRPDSGCDDITVNTASECAADQTRTLTADNPTTTITMAAYDNLFTCVWRVRGVAGSGLRVNAVGNFLTFSGGSGDCIWQWMEFRVESSDNATDVVPRYCHETPPQNIQFDSTSIIILLRSGLRTSQITNFGPTGAFTLQVSLDPLPTEAPMTTQTGDIDECASNPCMNGGDCNNGVSSYTCACVTGFMGPNCENTIATTTTQPTTTTTTQTEARVSVSQNDGVASAAFRNFVQGLVDDQSHDFCSAQGSSCCPSTSQYSSASSTITVTEFPQTGMVVFRTRVFATCLENGVETTVEVPTDDVIGFLTENNDDITQAFADCCTAGTAPDCCDAAVADVTSGTSNGAIVVPAPPQTPRRISADTIAAIAGGLTLVVVIAITCCLIIWLPRSRAYVRQSVYPVPPPGLFQPPPLRRFGQSADPYSSPIYGPPRRYPTFPLRRPPPRSQDLFSSYYY